MKFLKAGFIILGFSLMTWGVQAQGKKGYSQNQHKRALKIYYKELLALADNKHCEDPNEFAFAPIGTLPCGKPKAYIIYSKNINTKAFLNKLSQYNVAESNYNERWEVKEHCDEPQQPTGISCSGNKPVLKYN